VASKGVGVVLRRQEAEAYINKRAKELLKDLKEGMDVLVYMAPGAALESSTYEPMRVVSWKGEWQQKMRSNKTYINLAPYFPSDKQEGAWVWNDGDLCDKQYSECYTPEHPGFNPKTRKVFCGGKMHDVCTNQHCDPKPLTAPRPPLGVKLDELGGKQRRSARQAAKGGALGGAKADQYRTVLVSPGLHQKALQVLADDSAAHDEAYFS
jgi:hypothetical protein